MRRPTCINEGCNKPCITSRGKIKDLTSYVRFRPYCSNCFRYTQGKAKLKPGVKPFQKHRCSNLDNHLGFSCIIGKEGHARIKKIGCNKQMFQLDHKDGNSLNNVPENIQELCCMCHKHKSVLNKDYSGWRKKRRTKNKFHVELHYRRSTLSEVTTGKSLVVL